MTFLYVCIDALRPSQQFYSHVGTIICIQITGSRGLTEGKGLLPQAEIGIQASSPVPVQFDWDKIRTEIKPVKMARKEVQHAQKKSPKKKIRSNWRYFELNFFIIIDLGVYFPWLFTF